MHCVDLSWFYEHAENVPVRHKAQCKVVFKFKCIYFPKRLEMGLPKYDKGLLSKARGGNIKQLSSNAKNILNVVRHEKRSWNTYYIQT